MKQEEYMLYRVKDLSPEQKLAVEDLLGRSVSENDSVSIKALASSALVPSKLSDEQRQEALAKLNRYFARVDALRGPCSQEEEEATINEALRSTRPNYRPAG
jgi:hypothetical protein